VRKVVKLFSGVNIHYTVTSFGILIICDEENYKIEEFVVIRESFVIL